MLHIDKRVGSVKVGKDADLVLWSGNPLSIYAKAEKTFVDGIAYWDIDQDAKKQQELKADQGRIIQKMIEAKSSGTVTARPSFQRQRLYECETMDNLDLSAQNQ
jgi:urease alpha subunit